MAELKTETFSLQIPSELDQHRVIWETIRAEASQFEYEMQNPELNAGLGKQSDYDDLDGDDFLERFCNSLFENYENAQLVERLDNESNGQPGVAQISRISWDWDGKKADVYYINAAVVVDDLFHYEMRAYCEQPHWEEFRPLFLQTWETLNYFGDPADALTKQQEAIEALHNRYNPPKKPKPASKDFQIPEKREDIFLVDGMELTFNSETDLKITDFDGTFSVTLKADVPKEHQNKEQLFDEYEVERGVGFRLTFSDIHQAGVPTGQFDFEFGESEKRNTDLWDDGWEYSLEFTGEVVLRDGWLGLNGHLSKEWDPEEHFEVELYKKIDTSNLDWSIYRFSSLLETEGVPTHLVRFLSMNKPDILEFPPRLLEFTELRELSISNSNNYFPDPDKLTLGAIPEGISVLHRLVRLHISGTNLEALPESLGTLKNLEHLSVGHSCLKSTPPDIWRLPNLSDLYLANNQLTSIPDEIDLPKLTHLQLEENQLKTLPESLASQESLRKLVLSGNPLESIPKAINNIAEIELSMEDKLRLLDFTYPGADGQGCTDWNEESYFARSHPDLKLQLEQHRLSQALLETAKLALVLEHGEEEDYAKLGNTRFGGYPDLPASIPYPRFGDNEMPGKTDYVFEFLAQINCQDVAPLQEYLPRTGMLYFFLDTIHEMTPKVIYWDGESKELVSGKTLSFEEDDFFELPDPPYSAYRSEPITDISFPHAYSAFVNTHNFQGPAEALLEPEDILEEIEAELGLKNRQDTHEINSHVFTQHECPELQAALQKKGRPQDWMVLLKVASDGDFHWWDAGELFFVIHKSDLAKRDFSNIYCSLESS